MTDGKVVSLDAHRPHACGYVICWDCGAVWMAVWPAEEGLEERLECGDCGARRSLPISETDALIALALTAGVERRVRAALEGRGA